MSAFFVALMALGLLLAALAVEPLAERLNLPSSSLLVIIGFAASEIIVAAGGDTGVRWYSFHDLVLYLFLPVLVFRTAFNLDARDLGRRIVPILWLAIPAMLAGTAVTGTLIYLGIGHPAGFPLLAGLIAGVMIAATDPAAVLPLFERLGAPRDLTITVDGESLFNDAVAIVLFGLLVTLATTSAGQPTLTGAAIEFLAALLGGAAVGAAVGIPGWLLVRLYREGFPQVVITLAAAVLAYYLAEFRLEVSGVIAVLVAGLLLGEAHRRHRGEPFVHRLWQLNAYLANAAIFLLVGVTITVDMFTERWLAMLIGIGAALAGRAVVVYLLLPPVEWLPRVPRTTLAERSLLHWGGVRGAVTLALALSLPTELDSWWTIQSIVYGVVLFGLFVQAPTLPLLLRPGGVART